MLGIREPEHYGRETYEDLIQKIDVLKALGAKNFRYYQTLIRNPMYTNEEPEEVSEGYKSGGYVAIIAEK